MKVNIKTLTLMTTIAWFTLFISNFSLSQEAETDKKNDKVRGYLMLGGSKLNLDALNDRLMRHGNASFSDEYSVTVKSALFNSKKCNLRYSKCFQARKRHNLDLIAI